MTDEICVLAVDDSRSNLLLIMDMLTGYGNVQVLTAANGRQALDLLSVRNDIDIVLLDIEMPVMDGFATLREIQNNELLRSIPVIVITTNKTSVHKSLALGAADFMTKPFDGDELRLRLFNHVRSKKLAQLNRELTMVLEQEVVKKTLELQKALELSRETEYEITVRLGRAAEFRDPETGAHVLRISEMSNELGRLSGLSAHECEILRYASPLHDVGKIGIPDSILLKPGRLSDDEMEIMRQHTIIGGKILSDVDRYPVITAGQLISLQHHERWDGSGYPVGYAGTNIHIFARIVAIVDVLDALTSERPYKKAFSWDETLTIMREGRGTMFDPALLDTFLEHAPLFRQIRGQ